MNLELFSFIIGLSAFVCAILVGTGSFITAVLQKNLKISEFRQNWINEVKSEFTHLLNTIDEYTNIDRDDESKIKDMENDINRQITSLSLCLNPFEPDNEILIKYLTNLNFYLSKSKTNHSKEKKKFTFEDYRKELTILMQKILKKEWVRTKESVFKQWKEKVCKTLKCCKKV